MTLEKPWDNSHPVLLFSDNSFIIHLFRRNGYDNVQKVSVIPTGGKTMDNNLLKTAIELIRSGQKQSAQNILQPIIKADVHNIPVWFWYVETCSTVEQRIQILEVCAKYNPNNPQVIAALDTLRKQQMQPVDLPKTESKPSSDKPKAASNEVIPTGITQVDQKPAAVKQNNERIQGIQRPIKKSRSLAALIMWIITGVLVASFAFLAINFIRSKPVEPASHRFTQPIEYYLYVPKAYAPGRAWPLFIGIHGSGGSGLDCWNLWQSYAEREGFILLCPTLSDANGGWRQSDGERNTWAAINQVSTQYSINPKFFMVGFSAGAQFVQGFCFNYPQSTQAVAVLSAGNYYPPSPQAGGIPFLIVIGDRDDSAAINSSMQFAEALASNGSGVNYWLLPGVGHTITSKTKELTIDLFRAVNNQ
jgi:predicted esterase